VSTPSVTHQAGKNLTMIVIGHRGAKAEAPENTLAGFAYARSIGVRAFEFDVRLCGDGVVVLLHDETVDRTTDASGHVSQFSASQLARMDARGDFVGSPETGVPTLAEALDALCDVRLLQIEIKSDVRERLATVCRQVVDLVDRHGLADRVVVVSFDVTALAITRQLAPNLRRGLIGAYDDIRFVDKAEELGCWAACVCFRTTTREIVSRAQAAGLNTTAWTVNTVDDVATLLDWGVDNVTTDCPSVVTKYLRQRNCLETWDESGK
jgi:glycerophosphoryl diester phosphodiesterase